MTEPMRDLSGEQRLLSAAIDGDGRAFADLVRPHLPMMYRLALRGCGQPALAEDAVQEALTVAYGKLGRYRAGTSMRAYLATIVIKRTHTLLRSERRRRHREEISVAPSLSATPLQHAEATALGRRIRGVLATMPKKRRAAVMLRLDGGMDYAEISRALGTSEGSVRVLVHLALKELKSGLETYLGGGNEHEA